MGLLEILFVMLFGCLMYKLGQNKASSLATTSKTDESAAKNIVASVDDKFDKQKLADPIKKETPSSVEPKNKVRDENYWMMVLLYFASFLVGMGIVAEIAYNWDKIPNAVKLISSIILLIINAAALIWCVVKEKNVLKQVVACVFAFLIMAVIGLIGQVFQLQANVANGCLLWAAVSWPLLYFVPRLLWLWLPLFFTGMRFHSVIFKEAIDGLLGQSDWEWLSSQQILSINNVYMKVISVLCMYGYFIVYTLWVNYQRPNKKQVTKPLRFYSGLLMLSIYGVVVELVRHRAAIAVNFMIYVRIFGPYLLMAGLIFMLNFHYKRFSFLPLFFIGTVLEALLVMTLKHNWFGASFETAVPGVYVLLMLMYAYYHKMPRFRRFMTVILMVWFIITFEADIFDVIPSLLICTVWGFLSYKMQSRRGFNAAVILAVLRILIYYGEVKDLQYMGLYLIGSGLLMIATILGLMKYGRLLWRNENEK